IAFRRKVDPGMLDAFIAKKSGDVQDLAGYAAQIQAVLGHDTFERLPQIGCPTLILTGDDDQIIPAASSEVLRERISGSQLRMILGAGHLFFIERPGETYSQLREFLAEEVHASS
ncbi:MAG TPA: alpha/beta hydrolase, partial [Solirubrobacteraceae bacterium]